MFDDAEDLDDTTASSNMTLLNGLVPVVLRDLRLLADNSLGK